MDFDQAKGQATPAQTCMAGLFGCAWFAASVCFTVYCGIYAFNNPEPQAYYVPDTAFTEPQLIPIASPEDDSIVPIHDQFILWFKWSFANICAFFGLICCFFPVT